MRSALRPHNERPHTDEELKQRIVELRGRGYIPRQIAAILNEQGWMPLKGRLFTECGVRKLLPRCDEKKLLTPLPQSLTPNLHFTAMHCDQSPASAI